MTLPSFFRPLKQVRRGPRGFYMEGLAFSVKQRSLPLLSSTTADESMFAGMPGRGAEDASYEAAVFAEHAALHDEVVSGAVADIFKCFDQLPRPLLYCMLLIGGMPSCIVTAYRNFQENIGL